MHMTTNIEEMISDLRQMSSKEWIRGKDTFPTPVGCKSVNIKFRDSTHIRRVAITGILNIYQIRVFPSEQGSAPFVIGVDIRRKKGWDSGMFQPILANGIQLVSRHKRKGKQSSPSSVRKIVILK